MTSDHSADENVTPVSQEPYYVEADGEIGMFTAAYDARLPVMLKGPTGCGKSRFVEYMAYRLQRPLVTVGPVTRTCLHPISSAVTC